MNRNVLTLLILAAGLFLLARAAAAKRMEDDAMRFSARPFNPRQTYWADTIAAAAEAAGINPEFMVALAVTESRLDPAAIGDDGKSFGLFQLQLRTAQEYDVVSPAELLDGEKNIALAMRYMAWLMRHWPGFSFGDYAEAWTLGGTGRFELNRRNPGKVTQMLAAISSMKLALDLSARPELVA